MKNNATKRFIEVAIEGGYRLNSQLDLSAKYTVQTYLANKDILDILPIWIIWIINTIIYDPLAFQAAGKVLGWEEEVCRYCHNRLKEDEHSEEPQARCILKQHINHPPLMEKWQANMHRLIDHLAEASNKPNFDMNSEIEEFLATLFKE